MFGHTDFEITSLDYIELLLENGESIKITMLQTNALYATPYGEYEKKYR